MVVVGSGFAGFFAARTIERRIPPGVADLTIISAAAHMCYSPLLPEVAAGRLNALQIAVPCTVHYAGPASCKGLSPP
jgi:NADH dehydrogenase